jgi:hypothetical protein
MKDVVEAIKEWYYTLSHRAQFLIAVAIGASGTGGSAGLANWIGLLKFTVGGN